MPPATPLPVPTPPPISNDEVLSWLDQTFGGQMRAQLAAMPPLTTGRPMFAAGLSFAAVRAYRPGQRVDQLVQTGGEWYVPVLAGDVLVGGVHVDGGGRIEGGGGGFAQNVSPQLLSPFANDPAADVWLVGVGPPPIVSVLLIRRGADERMAFTSQGPPAFYSALAPLADREVTPEEMMPALRRAVEQHCTVFLVLKQC